MTRLCVFCGSSPGAKPAYVQAARRFGRALVRRGCGLVYGGGRVGMMGAVADAVLEAGGEAVGVVPDGLFGDAHVHPGLTGLRFVSTMAERKALMVDLSDGFVALPGGIGTLDELFEMWVGIQLGLHALPCGLLNVAGYFDPMLSFLDRAVEDAFVHDADRALLQVDTDAERLIERLLSPSGSVLC